VTSPLRQCAHPTCTRTVYTDQQGVGFDYCTWACSRAAVNLRETATSMAVGADREATGAAQGGEGAPGEAAGAARQSDEERKEREREREERLQRRRAENEKEESRAAVKVEREEWREERSNTAEVERVAHIRNSRMQKESQLRDAPRRDRLSLGAINALPYTEESRRIIEAAGPNPTKSQVEEILMEKYGTKDPGMVRKEVALYSGEIGDQKTYLWRLRKLVSIMLRQLKEEWEPKEDDSQLMKDITPELIQAVTGKWYSWRVLSMLDRCEMRRQCRILHKLTQRKELGDKEYEELAAELRRKSMILQEFEIEKGTSGEPTLRNNSELRRKVYRILGVHQRMGSFKLPENFLRQRVDRICEVDRLTRLAKRLATAGAETQGRATEANGETTEQVLDRARDILVGGVLHADVMAVRAQMEYIQNAKIAIWDTGLRNITGWAREGRQVTMDNYSDEDEEIPDASLQRREEVAAEEGESQGTNRGESAEEGSSDEGGSSQKTSENGEEAKGGEEEGQGEETGERRTDGLLVNQPDLINIVKGVHFDKGATAERLEEMEDDVYGEVEESPDGVWIQARSYAEQEALDMTDPVDAPDGVIVLRDVYPTMWRRPNATWEAIRNLIKHGVVQQERTTRGLMLVLPRSKRKGKEGRGVTDTGGVEKIRKPNGS
jgi:hypothetical protein